LVVDDRAENRQLLVKFLAPLGFELHEARNGVEAVAQWQSHRPHLIWMDIRMPEMDGYEATRRIKAAPGGQDTVIIALTASVFEEDRANILAAGCQDFVRKPISEAVLLEKLAQHLGVVYRYAEATEPPPPEPPLSLDSRPLIQALAQQPETWVRQLYRAARGADEEEINALVAQLPTQDTDLAQAIATWVEAFRLDDIIKLTEAWQAPRSSSTLASTGVGLAKTDAPPRVLIVDDRVENRELLRRWLEPIGFVIAEATDGVTAVDTWKTFQPQVILMDIRMPGMNGIQAARHIQQEGGCQAPPIIAMTASGTPAEQAEILAAGCDILLFKPLNESELISTLAQVIPLQYRYPSLEVSP
jgi:CheY-like chemotaxis protein